MKEGKGKWVSGERKAKGFGDRNKEERKRGTESKGGIKRGKAVGTKGEKGMDKHVLVYFTEKEQSKVI